MKTNSNSPAPLVFQQDISPNSIKQQHFVASPGLPGDLYYGQDGVNFQRLAIGSIGQVLTVQNGTVSWQYLLLSGTAANRPSGSFTGQSYFATDTFVFSVWTGSVWKSTTLA